MKSKVYGVKSNAARAAAKYGLTRANLEAVSGGWCFEVPAGQDAGVAAPRFASEVAPPTVESAEPDITDAEILEARKANMVVNGQPILDAVTGGGAPGDVPKFEPACKPPRKTRKPKAVKPAKAKPAKPARTPKPANATGHKVAGDPCYQGRRVSQGKRGITEELIKFLRRGWRTQDACLELTGWVSNTFRGILSLEKKKQGFEVERRKNKDDVTEFRIVS